MPQPNGKFIRRQESRLTARLFRRFQKQMADVIEAMAILFPEDEEAKGMYDRTRVRPGWTIGVRHKADSITIGRVIDSLTGFRETVEDVVAIARPSFKGGAKYQGARLPLAEQGIDFALIQPDAEQYMRRLRDLNLSNYRGSITRTTKDRIKEILTESVETGRSYDETARLIRAQGKAGVFSRSRAQLIATNQVGNAYEQGKRQTVERFTQETGVTVRKKWQTSNDDRVTEECAEYEDMGLIGLEDPFTSSSGTSDMRAPRKTNPRCRCNTAYEAV